MIRCLVLTTVGTLMSAVALAQTGDHQIPYQGRLELDGVAVSGQYDFWFELYPTPTGGDCQAAPSVDCLWADEILGVEVTGGAFSVVLGSVANPLGDVIWQNAEVYLGIRVASPGDGYTPLAGRQRILAVPMAAQAATAKSYHVTGTLQVDGVATLASDASVGRDLSVGRNVTIAGTLAVTGDVTGLTVTLTDCAWVVDDCRGDGSAIVYLDRANGIACPANKVMVDWNVRNCGGNTFEMSYNCCALQVR